METTEKDELDKNKEKKGQSKKSSRIEKQLENAVKENKEEIKNVSETASSSATIRIDSIRDELKKIRIENDEDDESDIDENLEEIEELEENNKVESKKSKKKKKIFLRILRVLFILGLLGIIVLAFLLYGPWDGFRDWYITSAMTTMNHQWLATMFYSQETIDEVLSRNKINEVSGITDNSLIKKASSEEMKKQKKYANEYEKAILEKDPAHEDYKIINIEGKAYNGYLVAIYDASKIHTMVTSKINIQGQYVTQMAEREGAVIAINGGGFDDPNYSSNGGTPTGITYSRGKLITNKNNAGSGGLIGFTNDDVLTLGRMNSTKADELGMRDAVTCGPFLIINGESSEILGNGGWGQAARTVIGQRKDGIVLWLVLNGRNYATGILGADMNDLIEIMQNYGAYNAACLDGGTSSVLVENNKILNDPIDSTGKHKTRWVPTAFGLFLNE